MNKIFYIILLMISINSCGQEKSISKIENSNKMFNDLQIFKIEPIYQIKVESKYSYEILVNDIPILRSFSTDSYFNMNSINSCIEKSGTQSLKIIIYPVMQNTGVLEEYLRNDNDFSLAIEKTFWDDGSLSDPETVFEYQMSNYDPYIQKQIDFSELNSYEKEFEFNAEVPYSLERWSDARKLRKKEKLLKEVESYYNKLKYYFENQQGEKYMKELEKGMFNLYQSNYFSTIKANNHYNKRIKFINQEKRELSNVSDYDIEIFGFGRLVALRKKDLNYDKGEGILRRYYKDNVFEKVQIEEMLLYKPKDKDSLEVIWFMGASKGAKM